MRIKGNWILFALVYITLSGLLAWLLSEPQGVIQGVSIGGTHVGGWNRQQLHEWVRLHSTELSNRPVTLFVGARRYTVKPSELGVRFDLGSSVARVWLLGREPSLTARLLSRYKAWTSGITLPLLVHIDKAQMRKALKRFESPPQNATVEVRRGQVRIVPSLPGIVIPPGEAYEALRRALSKSDTAVFLQTRFTQPEVREEHLSGIVLRATVSVTITSAHPGALKNAQLAVRSLDRTIIRPHDTFSINQLLGRRTAEKGYAPAPVIINERQDVGIGGGICVVSTALYQAAALAGLVIVERHPHRRPVRYAPPGLDATLNYPNKDLKLKNSTGELIVLRLYIRNRQVIAQVFGAPQSERFRLETQTQKEGRQLRVKTFRVNNARRELIGFSTYLLQ